MGTKIKTLSPITIATAGVPVQVSVDSLQVDTVFVEADSLNTGNVFYGGSTVSATNGKTITPGEIITIEFQGGHGTKGPFELQSLYLDTATNGNKARIAYIV